MNKFNWLRAAVLGANDGIVSVSSIVVGVAGAANSLHFILTAGVAGMVAGGLSMAVGEYVSVSIQRDSEKALLQEEFKEPNPWHAAYASAFSFFCGGIIPLIAITLPGAATRIPVTFIAVLVALIITGILSAHIGGANRLKTTIRVVVGGVLAMVVTFGVGKLFGVIGI